MEKLESYKGIKIDHEMLCDLLGKAELTSALMSVVFALQTDNNYTKEEATKEILDIISEKLDLGFVNPHEIELWQRNDSEMNRLKRRIKELEAVKQA